MRKNTVYQPISRNQYTRYPIFQIAVNHRQKTALGDEPPLTTHELCSQTHTNSIRIWWNRLGRSLMIMRNMPFKNENNLSYVNMGNGAYICLAFAHKRCRSVARALPSSSAVIDIYLSNVDLSRCVVASSQTVCLAFARITEIACDHNRHFATIYDRRKTIYIYTCNIPMF